MRVGNDNRDKETGGNINFKNSLRWQTMWLSLALFVCLYVCVCLFGMGYFWKYIYSCEDNQVFTDNGPIQVNSLCGDFEGPGEVIKFYLFNFFWRFFSGKRHLNDHMWPAITWTVCDLAGETKDNDSVDNNNSFTTSQGSSSIVEDERNTISHKSERSKTGWPVALFGGLKGGSPPDKHVTAKRTPQLFHYE